MGDNPFPWQPLTGGDWPFPLSQQVDSRGHVSVRGTLGRGVECLTILTDSGKGYTLVGVPNGFGPGDHVELSGVLQEFSFCMQGQTIAVDHISKLEGDSDAKALAAVVRPRRLVMEVDRLQVQVLLREPPLYNIQAFGKVPTTGWSQAALVPVPAIEGSVDGIYDFRFEATPPEAKAGDVVVPILAHLLFDAHRSIRGIRVHSASNTRVWPDNVSPLSSPAGGGEIPSPF